MNTGTRWEKKKGANETILVKKVVSEKSLE